MLLLLTIIKDRFKNSHTHTHTQPPPHTQTEYTEKNTLQLTYKEAEIDTN